MNKMSWNFRVLVKRTEGYNNIDEEQYGIHEVYYDDNGIPHSCTETACDPYGETVEELKDSMIQMMGALVKPTMEYDDIGEEFSTTGNYDSSYSAGNESSSTGRWNGRGPQGIRGPVDEVPNLFENLRYDSKKVRDVVNDLYRTSYLDHYAKKKILEAMEEWDGCL